MSRVSYDVGVLRRAPILDVWAAELPWNKGRNLRKGLGHSIVVYGYDSLRGRYAS
ncbi:hypothetical protein [Nonomuraea sp. KM88]|uniref:hypothetical protein n=1 Tax=Nonomuraea sp. KM88 TaxID=3457427 RepID=UPI003FCC4FA6